MRTRSPHSARHAPHALLLGAALGLAACGDDGVDDSVGVGGGAGDADENAAVLEPYVGTWDLTGPWRGVAGDEAYLIVAPPGGDGRSRAALYDFDELAGCYERPATGTVAVDPFGAGVFMNDILSFEQATLSIDGGGALSIDHTDAEDADRDGDRGDRVTYVAPRNDGLAEADLEPAC